MKVLAATNNKNKLREFKEILNPLGYEILSIDETGITLEPKEDAATFEGNAVIKATEFAKVANMAVIADDSGLEVDCLGGAPGVYSARYAPGSDKDRTNKLLENMSLFKDRTARFVSVIAMVFPNGKIITARGECVGKITYVPEGENGFGYDPVFFCEEFGKTFANLLPEEKNSVSHRGKAIKKLTEILSSINP